MKCPHCAEEIAGTRCPDCETENPEEAKYCMACGSLMNVGIEPDAEADEELDMDDRELCPDGTCTGILVDGKCSECGKTPEEAEKSGAASEP